MRHTLWIMPVKNKEILPGFHFWIYFLILMSLSLGISEEIEDAKITAEKRRSQDWSEDLKLTNISVIKLNTQI